MSACNISVEANLFLIVDFVHLTAGQLTGCNAQQAVIVHSQLRPPSLLFLV